jgi:hypothetical protein
MKYLVDMAPIHIKFLIMYMKKNHKFYWKDYMNFFTFCELFVIFSSNVNNIFVIWNHKVDQKLMKFEKILLTLKGLVAKKMIKTHQIEWKKSQIFTKIEGTHTLPPMNPCDRKIYLWQKFTKNQ